MAGGVLVTGAAGFIGSHVCEALVSAGRTVCGLDNFDEYYDPRLKHRNVRELLETGRFSLIEGDIRDPAALDAAADQCDASAIIHLAARAGVRPSIEDPALYSDVNVTGTTQVLELARRRGIDRFLFASSSSVYGAREEVPFKETDLVDAPHSPYAATKRAGELLARTYHELFGIEVACLRFFTVYGPRQRPEMAISKFVRLVDEGERIPLFGDGSAERDFTFVGDIVNGILRALEHHTGYDIYNLGNRNMVTLTELIAAIGEAVGREPIIEYLPKQPGDVPRTCASVDHAGGKIGYEPSTKLVEGLGQYVEWMRTVEGVESVTG